MTALTGKETMVGMGQVAAAQSPDRLWSILGSCVAVALCDAKRKVAALSHVVLPASCGRSGAPGKFADTAIPHMLSLIRQFGVSDSGLTAKITGGARMFGHAMPMEVGENNVRCVLEALEKAGIRVAGRDIGGDRGRRATLDCATGKLLIQTLGSPPVEL